jgi:hypothetical protein
MIDAETLGMIPFEWPAEFFYYGAGVFLLCFVAAFGIVWVTERLSK